MLKLSTTRLRGGTYAKIGMAIDKISGVTLRITRAGSLVHTRYVGSLARGPHTLGWQVPRKAGAYEIQLIARDLAGNPGSVSGPLEVLKPKKKKKKAKRG